MITSQQEPLVAGDTHPGGFPTSASINQGDWFSILLPSACHSQAASGKYKYQQPLPSPAFPAAPPAKPQSVLSYGPSISREHH